LEKTELEVKVQQNKNSDVSSIEIVDLMRRMALLHEGRKS